MRCLVITLLLDVGMQTSTGDNLVGTGIVSLAQARATGSDCTRVPIKGPDPWLSCCCSPKVMGHVQVSLKYVPNND